MVQRSGLDWAKSFAREADADDVDLGDSMATTNMTRNSRYLARPRSTTKDIAGKAPEFPSYLTFKRFNLYRVPFLVSFSSFLAQSSVSTLCDFPFLSVFNFPVDGTRTASGRVSPCAVKDGNLVIFASALAEASSK